MSLVNYAHPEVFVDTQWVAEHLSEVRLIQVDMDATAYDGHIKGHPTKAFLNSNM